MSKKYFLKIIESSVLMTTPLLWLQSPILLPDGVTGKFIFNDFFKIAPGLQKKSEPKKQSSTTFHPLFIHTVKCFDVDTPYSTLKAS